MNQRTRNSCLLHRENPCVRKLYRPSLYTNIYLFLARVPQHTENGSPTALEATLANPHTHTIVETFGKCYVYGVLRFRTSIHYVTINDSPWDIAKNAQANDWFAKKLWKYDYRCNELVYDATPRTICRRCARLVGIPARRLIFDSLKIIT